MLLRADGSRAALTSLDELHAVAAGQACCVGGVHEAHVVQRLHRVRCRLAVLRAGAKQLQRRQQRLDCA